LRVCFITLIAAMLVLSSFSPGTPGHASADDIGLSVEKPLDAMSPDSRQPCDDQSDGSHAGGCCMTSASCSFCVPLVDSLSVAPTAAAEICVERAAAALASGLPEFDVPPPRHS
jgi:hypothetical protein